MNRPVGNNPNKPPTPSQPDQGQVLQPKPDTEINTGRPATSTEVDLDKGRTKTYPGTRPPERHKE